MPEIKSVAGVPVRLHSKNLIEFSLDVSVKKLIPDDLIDVLIP